MSKSLITCGIAGALLSVAILSAQQEGVIERGEPTVLRGELVEVSCYQKKGVAEGTGTRHTDCAKLCVRQGKPVGLLTDGDGLYLLVGNMTNGNNAKLAPYLGQLVDVAGTQVLVSNSYSIRRSFDVQKVTPVKK